MGRHKTSETEVVGRELVISLQPKQPSSAMEDSGHAPQVSKRLIGVAVLRVFLLRKRIPVLPPKHRRREGGCLNDEERLERGWKILSLGLPPYLASPY